MFLLFYKTYDENDFVGLSPYVVSKSKSKIEEYLEELLKPSSVFDIEYQKHADECRNIIKSYLLNNYDAITGWNDVRQRVKTSYPITAIEKNSVITFLSENYQYCYGEHILENLYPISKYCDINKLNQPYPRLSKPPRIPTPYYKRDWFYIEEIKDLDE